MISLRVDSSDTIKDWDGKTINPTLMHTTKDIRGSMKILGFGCLLIVFIFLLFASIIINNQYAGTAYIQFGLQIFPTVFATLDLDTSGLDDTTNRASGVLHRSNNMRYTSYDTDEMHPLSLVIQSINLYNMVCDILYPIRSHHHSRFEGEYIE